MKPKTEFNKNHSSWFVNKVIWAIKNYAMIEQQENLGVALSGGKDSSVLLFILWYINRYTYLKFKLTAFHAHIANYDFSPLQSFCEHLDIPIVIVELPLKYDKIEGSKCSFCSRFIKGSIIRESSKMGIKKIAFGHSATDVAETFFMNISLHKKLGTFTPKLHLSRSRATIIRPLIYLSERTISKIRSFLNIPLMPYKCPYAKENIRARFKDSTQALNQVFGTKEIETEVVASLENIDWKNIWRKDESL